MIQCSLWNKRPYLQKLTAFIDISQEVRVEVEAECIGKSNFVTVQAQRSPNCNAQVVLMYGRLAPLLPGTLVSIQAALRISLDRVKEGSGKVVTRALFLRREQQGGFPQDSISALKGWGHLCRTLPMYKQKNKSTVNIH